jgi:type VI secretion system protein ImpA
VNLEALRAPVSEAHPAGQNLEDSADRAEIRRAFDVPAAAEAIDLTSDWKPTERLILKQCALTRDIELGVYLARVGARLRDLGRIADGLVYLAVCVEDFWESCYPLLDDVDYMGRAVAVRLLENPESSFRRPLDSAILLAVQRVGEFSVGDVLRLGGADGRQQPDYGRFRAALEKTGEADKRAVLVRIAAIDDAFGRVEAAMTAHSDQGAFNLSKTHGKVQQLLAIWTSIVDGPVAVDAEAPGDAGAVADAAPAFAGASGGGNTMIGGPIQSREQVLRALDSISDYYNRSEPASPVRAMIDRMKAWVGMDFLSLIKDIAPDSLNEAKAVLQLRNEDE